MSVIRTLRTIRHLRPVQIVGQVRNRLRPRWEKPARFAARPIPAFGGVAWPETVSFLAPGAQGNKSASLCEGQFTFVNDSRSLGWPPADWQAPDAPKLWQYNLHYFEWLWALDYPTARTVLLDWIARHPLKRGHVGWEPYPTSLRLMNWCALCFGPFRAALEDDPATRDTLWQSIHAQAEWLCAHLETHLLGNHLFENGAALAFVGSTFPGEAAARWKQTGLDILRREIPEQILPDGMHFERAPMYHVRMTYLMKLLCDTGDPALIEGVSAARQRMEQALVALCHPDGEIALFNDSAFGIYNAPQALVDCAAAPAGPWSLPDAGYFGWRGEDGTYLICDAGLIGPDYIPGHAHGDLFSYELSIKGARVIVDSGVYDYVPSAMRNYCRSTAAHNTVTIENQDQSEFWGAFRVARRAYPRDVQWQVEGDTCRLSGWHTGYQRLPGQPTHHREFTWTAGEGLTVRDVVRATRAVQSVSRVHLHPQCRVKLTGSHEAQVDFAAGSCRISFTGAGSLALEDTHYCPEFGKQETNVTLAFTLEGKESEATYTVVPN